jgi:hypothetical protein
MIGKSQCSRLRWSSTILSLFVIIAACGVRANPTGLPSNADEISVSLSLSKVGTRVVPAIIIDQDIYIPIMDVLDFVKVKSDLSMDRKKISGFFIDESETYVIDLQGRNIRKGLSHIVLTQKDLIIADGTFYLKSDIYKKVFGIECQFNFNMLDVKLVCDRELPAVTDALRKKNANNISAAEGDLTIDRRYPLRRSILNAGVLDWSIGSALSQGIHTESYAFALGGDLLGGDIDARYAGSPQQHTTWRTIAQEAPWRWRYVTPESKLITQTMVGTISSMATTALADSVIGFQISNKPVQYNSAFATYTIRDKTEPGWTVELYINETLVKYVKADAAGNYAFAVPLSYGSTSMKLKFYGPWGEVQTKNVELRIPYTFLPPGHFEYSLTAGTNKNTLNFQNNVAQLNVDAGISTLLTVGGGVKYYKEAGFSPFAPFASVSTQLFNSVLLNGQWISGSGMQGHLSYSSSFGMSIEALYEHPFAHQRFGGLISAQDQRSLTVSAPIAPIQGSFSVSALDVQQNSVVGSTSATAVLNGQFAFIPLTLTTTAAFTRSNFRFVNQGVTAGLAFYFVGPFNILIKPVTGYDFGAHAFTQIGTTLQRGFGNGGQIGIDLHEDLINKKFGASIDVRYALPWVQLGGQAAENGGTATLGSSAQGSIIFDGASNEIVLSDRNFVERGGIIVRPFLDLNNDGIYERGEPIVKNFKVQVAGGRVVRQENGIVRVMDLDPYVAYTLKNSTEGVENLAWVPKYQTCSVMVDANSFNEVNIPISVAGQIGGYVRLVTKDGPEGQGGIKLRIRDRFGDQKQLKMPEDFLSYSTGEFYNIGLTPGKYQIYPDPEQMKRLQLISDPPMLNFELHNSPDGDIIDTLNFLLRIQGSPDTMTSPSTKVKSPTTISTHADLKEISLGVAADKILEKLGKPRDILLRTPLIAGTRTIIDTLLAGECALPVTRMIVFDNNNLLKSMTMVYHGHDVSKNASQQCLLAWLMSQYGAGHESASSGGGKLSRWQVGFTQITLEARTFSESEYDLFVSYARLPGK